MREKARKIAELMRQLSNENRQFAFGFYSLMLTSTLIGILVMLIFKPRSWCVFCPMGTMTQLISKIKVGKMKKNETQARYSCECSCNKTP